MESSYFAQLPTSLLLSPDLTCFQKLLYADIQSLTFQRGYCWASNEFLAERHNKSEKHISKQISKLIGEEHLFAVDRGVGRSSKGARKLFTQSTYLEYAKEKGIEINGVKNHTINGLNGVKNDKVSNISKDSIKELSKDNSSQSEQGNKSIIDSTKRDLLKRTKKHTVAPIKEVRSETIEIVDYWNSFDSLTTHNIKRKRNVAPLHQQTKTIQNIDCSLYKLLRGTFYLKHTNLQAGLKQKKWSMPEIKRAIERMAQACDPDYSHSTKRVSFMMFIHNPHMEIGSGKNRYRFIYPFLHFINNKPVKISNSPTRKKSEYPIIVDKTIKSLKGTIKPNDKQYNQVVKQVDKAIEMLKKKSNGRFAEFRVRLPNMLRDTMVEEQLALTVDNLPLGVYNLEKYMRKRLMIK